MRNRSGRHSRAVAFDGAEAKKSRSHPSANLLAPSGSTASLSNHCQQAEKTTPMSYLSEQLVSRGNGVGACSKVD